MIEILIREHLKQTLGLPVVLELPPDPPERFLLIQRTGGGEREQLCDAMVAVQSYAPSLLAAAELDQQVIKAMRSLALHPQICRVRLNTDYNFTDPVCKRYRWQAVFDITHYQED